MTSTTNGISLSNHSALEVYRRSGMGLCNESAPGRLKTAARAADVVTWRLLRSFGPDVSGAEPSQRMISAAMDQAARSGLQYESGIRHGMRAVTVAV